MFYVELIMDVVFILDIIFTFNSGYYSKGIIVMNRKKIILGYLRSWFFLDLVASFPYSYTVELMLTDNPNSSVESLTIAPRLIRMLKIIKFLRLLRLLRVLKLKKVLYKIEEYIVTDFFSSAMDGIKLLSIMMLINHLMACIFYFVGTFDNEYDPENWINQLQLGQLSKLDMYIT